MNPLQFKVKPLNFSPFGEKSSSKRKPLKTSLRTNKFADSGSKCQKCKCLLKGLKPHMHHKNGNHSDNRSSNILLVCPNCHSKLHRNMKPKTKQKKKETNFSYFGLSAKPRL
ncbi:MAG: HNH endonuclease signature motif containing protein [Candidatus Woesearchaeota archaeon]